MSASLEPDVDDFVFRGPLVRRLSAEQFLDSMDQLMATATRSPEESRGTGRMRWGLCKIDPPTVAAPHLGSWISRTLGPLNPDLPEQRPFYVIPDGTAKPVMELFG